MCLKWQSKLSKREDISLLFIPLLNSLQLVEQRSGFGLSENSFPWQVTVWGKHKTKKGRKKKISRPIAGDSAHIFFFFQRGSAYRTVSGAALKRVRSVNKVFITSLRCSQRSHKTTCPRSCGRRQCISRGGGSKKKRKNLPQMLFILFLLFFASTWSSLETVSSLWDSGRRKHIFLMLLSAHRTSEQTSDDVTKNSFCKWLWSPPDTKRRLSAAAFRLFIIIVYDILVRVHEYCMNCVIIERVHFTPHGFIKWECINRIMI